MTISAMNYFKKAWNHFRSFRHECELNAVLKIRLDNLTILSHGAACSVHG